MDKNKIIYIFMTHCISDIGGMQMYTAGMAQYLESQGCAVHFLSEQSSSQINPKISVLKKYLPPESMGCNFLSIHTYKLKNFELESCLNELVRRLNLPSDWKTYDIFVESCESGKALWGELLAAKLGAHHIFIASEEQYRRNSQVYEENLPFFYFKHKRDEIIGNDTTIKNLFNGYRNVTKTSYHYPPIVHEMHPIQDVNFPVEKILKCDWNICHMGRAAKDYVPYVIEGISELARHYPNKTINFICIGNMNSRMELLKKTFNGLKNIYFTPLGDMVPIPRNLFSRVDVVCAISQSARFAANEGVLTIVGNADTPEKTPGVLGYDTTEQVYGEPIFSYVEALENVLVKKLYDGKEYSLPKLEPEENYYKGIWSILENVSKVDKKYYVEIAKPRIRNWVAIFPFGMIQRGARIIFFGATEIAKDYRKQIESQKNSSVEFGKNYVKQMNPEAYCEIVATVDEHPEEFDDSIVGVERLKQKDYDAIVITTFPQNAQSAFEIIKQTVPQMLNRVVYHFQTLST